MWYIYIMEYYTTIKNNEFMNFLSKWMEVENIILSKVTQSQENTHSMNLLMIGYYFRILKYPRYNSQTTQSSRRKNKVRIF